MTGRAVDAATPNGHAGLCRRRKESATALLHVVLVARRFAIHSAAVQPVGRTRHRDDGRLLFELLHHLGLGMHHDWRRSRRRRRWRRQRNRRSRLRCGRGRGRRCRRWHCSSILGIRQILGPVHHHVPLSQRS